MTRFAAINLAALPTPAAIDNFDIEDILAESTAMFLDVYEQLRVRRPELPEINILNLEFDPVKIVLEVMAYREAYVRALGNDKYKAATLAYSVGTDLDNKVGEIGVERKVIDVGNPNATPPVPPTYESDADLRFRAQLAWEALSTAGPKGAYTFHALTADELVKDAAVFGPEDNGDTEPEEDGYIHPGQVLVVILSHEDGGTASPELIADVLAYLGAENRRPLTDEVLVESAEIEEYEIEAIIKVPPGASAEQVRLAAAAAVQAYADGQFGVGKKVRLSRIAAALYVGDDAGNSPVEDVEITTPATDIVTDARSAPFCTGVTVTVEVVG